MSKKIMLVAALLTGFAVFGAVAQENTAPEPQAQATEAAAQTQSAAAASAEENSGSGSIKYIAAAAAVAVACIAGGLAVGKIGAAAMGAMSENADLSGKALPFVGLAEGICLWGFLVALLIIIL